MPAAKNNSMEVKKANRQNTLRRILACERISQPELAQQLALSWPTVLQNVKELVALGLVREVGSYASTGGRKARAFAPVRDAKLALGLDITRNHIGLVLVDLAGGLERYERVKQPFARTDAYYRTVGEALQAFLSDTGYPETQILGVGVSIAGIVDQSGEMLVQSHALDVNQVPTEEFSRYIPYPCVFINDANAAGFAELWGKTVKQNTVYLSLSNSVGGAIFPEGRLYTGDHLRAGEFGHHTFVPGGKPCYCGKRGCFDSYCAARVLSSETEGNLRLFFEGVQRGDANLTRIWETYLDDLAIEINNLRMSFDCDVIVGGYVGGYLEDYAYQLRRRLEERNTFEPDAAYLKVCRYKQEASAVGAAFLQLERFIARL